MNDDYNVFWSCRMALTLHLLPSQEIFQRVVTGARLPLQSTLIMLQLLMRYICLEICQHANLLAPYIEHDHYRTQQRL